MSQIFLFVYLIVKFTYFFLELIYKRIIFVCYILCNQVTMIRNRLFTTLLILTWTLVMHAQFGKLYTPDDRLSSSLVNDIKQDNNGFVLIATQDGLNVFDGHTMHVYQKGDGSNLSSNYVNCVFQASDGRLFIGNSSAVQLFNRETYTFKNISPKGENGQPYNIYTQSIMERKNGDVLASTSGMGILRISKGQSVFAKADFPGGNYIRRVTEDRKGRLWIATDNDGIFLYDENNKPVPSTLHLIPEGQQNTIYCVFEDKKGNIYAASMNNGLYLYSEEHSRFYPISSTTGLRISAIHEEEDGVISLGTDGTGIFTYNPQDGSAVPRVLETPSVSISGSKIHAIMKDHEGNLWLGLFQRGVYFQPEVDEGFRYYGKKSSTGNIIGDKCVMSVYRDKKGITWVGTDGDGLYGIGPDGSRIAHFTTPATILSITEDEQGTLWVGSYLSGCGKIDRQTGRYSLIHPEMESVRHVFCVKADMRGHLWIASHGMGIYRYDLATGNRRNFRTSDYVNTLLPSLDGKYLFVGSCKGFIILDAKSGKVLSSSLKDMQIYSLYEFPDGTVWVGAPDGLFKITNHGKEIKQYTVENGLPNNTVRSVLADGKGKLWIGTNRGLSCMDTQTEKFTNYSTANGLQGNEFSTGAFCVAGDEFIFGGNNGITIFRADDLKTAQRPFHVRLVSFFVNGEPVVSKMKSGIYTICDTTVFNSDRFDLSYHDNSFSLSFSAMLFGNPEQVIYQYSINDKPWVSLNIGTNEVSFSNMAWGRYKVRVRAIYHGLESEISEFLIVVHAPWYATIWAFICYLLIALAALWYYLRNRKTKEQTRLRVQQFIHSAQLNEAKIQALEEKEAKHASANSIVAEKTETLQLKSPDEKLLERVMAVINKNIDNPELSVEFVSDEVGISRAHLHRKLKELTNQTPRDFIRNIRLKQAANLLSSGNQNVTEVMYAVGFQNPASFSTMFKNFYGVSPKEYTRERHKRMNSE